MAPLMTRVLGAASPCRRAATIRRLPQRQLLLTVTASYRTHHHQPGMHTYAHGESYALLLSQAGIEWVQSFQHPQPARTARCASSSCARG